MDGHQGDLVGCVFLFIFRKVHVAQQGDIFQEHIQRNHRQVLVAYLRHVFVGEHFLADFLAPVFHEHRHAVQQFLHVGGAGLSFDGRVGLERGQEGGLVRQPARQHIGRVRFYPLRSGIDHRAECLQVFYSRVFQPEGLQTIVIDRFKQRGPEGTGRRFEGRHRGTADSAGGFVDDAFEGLVIVHVHRQLEIGHHVLHLGPVEEGVARIDPVRQVAFAQRLFQGARLRVGAVQDGKILILGTVFLHPRNNFRNDEQSLLRFGISPDQMEFLALLPYRVALLRDASFVLGNQRVGSIHDVLGRAVVPLQAKHLAAGIVPLKIEDILDLGPAEGVDGLAVVAHHADVVVTLRIRLLVARQPAQDDVLGVVRILVLVHEDMVEPAGDFQAMRREPGQQDIHIQQDIIKIHHPGLLALGAVQGVDFMQPRPFGMQVLHHHVCIGPVGIGRDQVVLGHGDASLHFFGFIDLVVQIQFLDAGFHRAHRIRLVIDGEGGRIPQVLGIFTQEPYKYRMEGAHIEPPGLAFPDHGGNTFLHFRGCFFCKGQCHDPFRSSAIFQQIGNPAGQNPCLSRSGPGDNQHRPVQAGDSILLFTVQSL